MSCNLTHGHMPCMKFLFVRPDVCRQLPSDSSTSEASFRFFDKRSDKSITTSRWTPLPWAMRFPLLGLARDLHPLANAHAERTKKVRVNRVFTRTFFILVTALLRKESKGEEQSKERFAHFSCAVTAQLVRIRCALYAHKDVYCSFRPSTNCFLSIVLSSPFSNFVICHLSPSNIGK